MSYARTIADAIAIATHWITTSGLPFRSAFIGGSAAHADPHLTYNPASDIDCYLVVDDDPPAGKIGKITVPGVLLDVSWLPWDQLANAESHAVLASLLRFGQVTHDQDGDLSRLQQGVIARFTSSEMVTMRLHDMRHRIYSGLAVNSSHLSQPEQVMNWLFPATLATHMPLVAACAPLTVRKRFLAAKQVMPPTDYESLLDLYGFANAVPAEAQRWLNETRTLFDATTTVAAQSTRFWASDIHEEARAIAIGGSQHMIDSGHHREALYWIIATRVRCLTVLDDAGIDLSPFLPAFHDLTGSFQIETPVQRASRNLNIRAWVEAFAAPY